MSNWKRFCRAIPDLSLRSARALVLVVPISLGAYADNVIIESVVLRPAIEAEVPARQTGVLATISVEEGAVVHEGQTLAALDDRSARLALLQATLELDQAQVKAANRLRVQYANKALEVARAEIKRSAESNEQFAGSISQSQLDVERLTVEKLELERQQAELDQQLAEFDVRLKGNALAAAELELKLHAIEAPFAGVVSLVRGHVGEWVQPGTPVLRLVAIDRLRAEGFAPAAAVGAPLLGAEVQFTPAIEEADQGSFAPITGVLRFVSPEIDPVSRQVRVWAEIDNRQRRLRPGQQGRLIVPLDSGREPTGATADGR